MSEPVGEFIANDREPVIPSDVDGSSNAENGSGRTERNDSKPERVINGYESFTPPTGPVTERFGNTNAGSGEPRRTKSGKIDRRTRAGRTQKTPDSVEDLSQEWSKEFGSAKKLVSLEKAILSLHDLASGIFGIPELMLSEPEAKAINDAVLDVSKYYIAAFDPKKVAIFNLATCLGGIYAMRIMAYRHRVGMEQKTKLRVMPNQPEQPQRNTNARTIEEYLGGVPPNEGAVGY